MKTQRKQTLKRLTLNKQTVTVLTNWQQMKLIGGDGGPIKGGEGNKTSQIGG